MLAFCFLRRFLCTQIMNFYTDVYHGEILAPEKYLKWADRASDELDYITMNRIDDDTFIAYAVKIKKQNVRWLKCFIR